MIRMLKKIKKKICVCVCVCSSVFFTVVHLLLLLIMDKWGGVVNILGISCIQGRLDMLINVCLVALSNVTDGGAIFLCRLSLNLIQL